MCHMKAARKGPSALVSALKWRISSNMLEVKADFKSSKKLFKSFKRSSLRVCKKLPCLFLRKIAYKVFYTIFTKTIVSYTVTN